VTAFSEWHRNEAKRHIEISKKIEEIGDPLLVGLQEERDFLFMSYEEGKEVRAEWAAQARQYAPKDESSGCDCDVCAIGRALDKATA
jgi:hypothetical protein